MVHVNEPVWHLMMWAMIFANLMTFATNLAHCNETRPPLFTESFDDARLEDRGWYDLTGTRIAGDAKAGRGCIEFEWAAGSGNVKGSSPMRRLFEPTDHVYLR